MSTPPPSSALEARRREMNPPQNPYENGGCYADYGERESRSHGKKKRSRSRSKDHGRNKEKDKERDKDKEKSRRKRDRSRDRRRGGSKERERPKSKERVERPKSKERDRERDRERERVDRERHRESRGSEREKEAVVGLFGNGGGDRDRRNKDRERGDREKDFDRRRNSRERERERESRTRRSRSRNNNDDHEGRRSRSNRHERSRSRSHERHRREPERERGQRDRELVRNSRERERESERSSTVDREREHMEREALRLDPIKDETRESRFDLTQTIHELMANSAVTKNYASLFNCTNSNDSFSNALSENSQDGIERKRKRKSRWGGTENDKTFIPGMPTILPSTLDPTQQEAYLVQLQIEEISRKLRTGDLGIPQNPEERSPSPEPIYSSDGKRLNTREFRFRKRLEEQRHQLIQKMQSVNPEFKPPADYKPPVTRVSDKVLIPQEQHPDINFVGLLIGPRGNTLKAMEKETGAKIIIRGKGSVKEGKVGRKDGQPLPGEDEPLHAFITAPNPEAVKKAVDKIKDVIRQGIEVPEGHNDLRRMQLRELAQLNGTLRETDCQRCTNCGSSEHKSWLCPDKPNVTNNIVCTACGGAGHISRDCRSKRPGAGGSSSGDGTGNSEDSQAKIDEEYMSLMAELGEGPPPSAPQRQSGDPQAQTHLNRAYNIFDKKPSQLQAIQAPSRDHMNSPSMHSGAPPPPMPPSWGNGSGNSMGIPPLIPPPPAAQPMPPAPPPLMSWMPPAQPPPPGGDTMSSPIPPPPPGTGPLPPLIPPPPPGTQAPLPQWSAYGGWGSAGGGYIPPPPPGVAPPPPPCAPPPPPPPM